MNEEKSVVPTSNFSGRVLAPAHVLHHRAVHLEARATQFPNACPYSFFYALFHLLLASDEIDADRIAATVIRRLIQPVPAIIEPVGCNRRRSLIPSLP
jgi:hypothetical protein